MALCEIVLRRPYREDEVRVADLGGGADGSTVELDGDEWVVMMAVAPKGTDALKRLICVRREGLV